jgi:hypothetical protein
LSEESAAGWYEHGEKERYWDGSEWTDEYRDSGGEQNGPKPVIEHTGVTYKVLTQKDRFFGGKFDPQKLEGAINAYAQEGWRVTGVATADIPSFGSSRQELVVVLERPR